MRDYKPIVWLLVLTCGLLLITANYLGSYRPALIRFANGDMYEVTFLKCSLGFYGLIALVAGVLIALIVMGLRKNA